MNYDAQCPRYLCFVDSVDDIKLETLKSKGLFNLIIRKHSESIELDFRYKEDLGKTGILSIIENGEVQMVEDDFSSLSSSEILFKTNDLIKEERYWECHNYLEELWKRYSGHKKGMVHDLIGIIVSQIKAQMDQWEVGKRVYERSYKALKVHTVPALSLQLPSEFRYPLKISLDVISSSLED